jgi:NADPH:quinone reductase-like Zn-dependent oxidoreductase
MSLFSRKEPLPPTMQALELRAYDGEPSSLAVVERPLPRLRHGEVLVRIAATPINPSDLMFLLGLYVRKDLPVVPGFEASGQVVASGGGIGARALVGRRVACGAPRDGDGTWAEYMAVPASQCVPLLPGVDIEAAASLIANPMTAWALLDIADKRGHRALLQTAAASAVGQMLVRLTERRRIPMIHVVRRPAQVDQLRSLGAVHVFDSSDPDFDVRLEKACRRLGVTLAFDAVAGDMTGRIVRALPRRARVIVYGALSQEAVQVHAGDLIFGHKRIGGFWLTHWISRTPLHEVARAGLTIQQKLGEDFRTEVQARLPLAEVHEAIARYKASMTRGKVLLLPARSRS